MIGSIHTVTVVAPAYRNDNPNGVIVRFADGKPGHLHTGRMIGATVEAREETRKALVADTTIEVEVVGTTTVEDAEGFKVSQWGPVKRKLVAAAEKMVADQTVAKAIVSRVAPEYAIVALPYDLQGLLHVSRVAGSSDEEKAARFQSIQVGDSIQVLVTEAKRPGRVRVAEFA
jgi:ribosomal protein S1